ncbi:hypothetical protein NL676_024289 [Syzygium grande]|nr:hypothetical protein NL676_024289 [Syzygium grande]
MLVLPMQRQFLLIQAPQMAKKVPLAKTEASRVAAEGKVVAPPAVKDVYVVSECKQASPGAPITFPPPPPPLSSSEIMFMDRVSTHGNGVCQAGHGYDQRTTTNN